MPPPLAVEDSHCSAAGYRSARTVTHGNSPCPGGGRTSAPGTPPRRTIRRLSFHPRIHGGAYPWMGAENPADSHPEAVYSSLDPMGRLEIPPPRLEAGGRFQDSACPWGQGRNRMGIGDNPSSPHPALAFRSPSLRGIGRSRIGERLARRTAPPRMAGSFKWSPSSLKQLAFNIAVPANNHDPGRRYTRRVQRTAGPCREFLAANPSPGLGSASSRYAR